MDIQKIKQLIDLLALSDLSELELVEGEHKVRLVKRVGAAASNRPGELSSGAALPAAAKSTHASTSDTRAALAMPAPRPAPEAVITAPLYGVLHLTPSPDEPAFVKPGDWVQAGQTLCVVEAMKMFHEVKAARAGLVLAILATAGQEVESGQALFSLSSAQTVE